MAIYTKRTDKEGWKLYDPDYKKLERLRKEYETLRERFDALTQENADLHARLAGYEQAEKQHAQHVTEILRQYGAAPYSIGGNSE